YFRNEPLPGRNALVPNTGDRVNYPTRPVDTSTDIEGTTSLQPSQPPSGNAVAGNMQGAHHPMGNRGVPRMPVVGMPRMPGPGIAAYGLASQAGMGGGMNPSGIPMQRGMSAQAQQQQVAHICAVDV
ncbi:hypothetical protein CRG98_007036, partial [Punica granatum]